MRFSMTPCIFSSQLYTFMNILNVHYLKYIEIINDEFKFITIVIGSDFKALKFCNNKHIYLLLL